MTKPGSSAVLTANSFDMRRGIAAIFFLSLSVLLFEIAFTRILSVVLWYHWAFLCISLAMLGLGAPGIWFSLTKNQGKWVSPLMLGAGFLIPASVVAVLQFGNLFPKYTVLFCMVVMLIPLLCLGAAICLLLIEAKGPKVGQMYGADLAGACLGALLIVPLLHFIKTPLLIGGIGFLPLVAHYVLNRRLSRIAIAIAILIISALAYEAPFKVRYTKSYTEASKMTPLLEAWTPTARLAIFDTVFWVGHSTKGFAWGRGKNAILEPMEQYWLEQDGSAGTPITRYSGNIQNYEYLLDDSTAVGYELRPPQTVAIIGAGGGRDILTSRFMGAAEIDAVELNGKIVSLLSKELKDFTGDIYHQENVHAIVSEGRSFLTRTSKPYDMIQISLIDSWAATAAGAFALSENNLYTVEAFRLYFNRLSAEGMLSTSRWVLGILGIEVPRLILLAQEALRKEGISNPNSHLAVIQGGRVGTLLLSKAPFSNQELTTLEEICKKRGFALHYPVRETSEKNSNLAAIVENGSGILQKKGLSLTPPTDEKPFFFQVLSPFINVKHAKSNEYGFNGESIYTLQLLMMIVSGVTLLLFFLPFILYRWFPKQGSLFRGSLYFFFIGVGFMLVEIPWLQKFILYLGHPSYATTVVLACLLLGASLGAMFSSRIGVERLKKYGLLFIVLLLGVNSLLSVVFPITLGLPFFVRIVLALIFIFPPAFCMGLFFPLGMLRFGDDNKPWFWAMNGAASVLASIISLALSMEFGFSRVVLLGAVFYAVAWVLFRGRSRPVDAWSE